MDRGWGIDNDGGVEGRTGVCSSVTASFSDAKCGQAGPAEKLLLLANPHLDHVARVGWAGFDVMPLAC